MAKEKFVLEVENEFQSKTDEDFSQKVNKAISNLCEKYLRAKTLEKSFEYDTKN